MLNDFAVGPFVLDFTNSAFEEKPPGGSTPKRFVASITVFPSMPSTLSRASATAPPGTATTTASASEASPPSRPILVTSWPALSQRSASPPPTLPLPITATFISLLCSLQSLAQLPNHIVAEGHRLRHLLGHLPVFDDRSDPVDASLSDRQLLKRVGHRSDAAICVLSVIRFPFGV